MRYHYGQTDPDAEPGPADLYEDGDLLDPETIDELRAMAADEDVAAEWAQQMLDGDR